MYVYVDESGTFTAPRSAHRVSAVAAVVIPESQRRSLVRSLARVMPASRSDSSSERKGSSLSETEASAILGVAGSYNVVAEICAIDTGLQSEESIKAFQQAQAERMIAGLTPEHAPAWWSWSHNLRAATLKLPTQLFVQSMLTMTLLSNLLETATIFCALRMPRELARFRWRIDAKDRSITPYEKLWTETIMPMAQSKSMREPIITLSEGNYAHMERFSVAREDAPQKLQEHMELTGRPGGFDLRKIFQEDLQFVDSRNDVGVRLADVVASVFTRAVNGAIGEAGWRPLSRLMVRSARGPIMVVRLDDDSASNSTPVVVPYGRVIRTLNEGARDLLRQRSGG
jgi:hypothetical protein